MRGDPTGATARRRVSAVLAALASIALAPSGRCQERELVEPTGALLRVVEDGLARTRDGRTRVLECADAAGTGPIHDLSLDPAGLVFVAAERGLFVLGPAVDHLDRIELGEGAPAGVPRSVHVDRRRRVWVATDAAVGVLDPSFHWGRTLGADVLPGAGPYAFVATDEGLSISGADGEVFYGPDAGPSPRIVEVRIEGELPAEDAPVLRGYGEPLGLTARGEGAGGATLRYRVDGHHVWRELGEDVAFDGLSPGTHRIDVVAIDRDLNRSPPFPVKVRVSYPFYFGKGFVLGVGAVSAALVLSFFLLRARRLSSEGGGSSALGRAFVSTAVFLVCAVQVLAGLFPHAKGWPFVGYSMYSERYDADQVIHEGVLVGLRPDRRELAIDPQALGVAVDDRWQTLHPLIEGGDAAAAGYLARYRARFPRSRLVGLQVQARRVRLTARGPIRVAPLVLAHYLEEGTGG